MVTLTDHRCRRPYRDRSAPLTSSLPPVSSSDRPDPPRTLGEATAQLEAVWAVIGEIRRQFEPLAEDFERVVQEN